MTYHQITLDERIAISTLRKEGLCAAAIARRLGRHRSTISRELSRNSCGYDGAYRFTKAQRRTNGRRWRTRRGLQHTTEQYRCVEGLLEKKFSPEQISGHLKRHGDFCMSHETIYRYVWANLADGGSLYAHLRGAVKQRRKRRNSYDSRGRLAGKRMIDERPAEIESRRTKGHWEIDTVMGRGDKDCIVTLVERKTGYTLIGKLANRTTAELNKRVISLIKQHGAVFKTITADNGTEFHGYKEIEAATDVRFYFAHPHHSWERGTNENTNGLIRQYLPKGKTMAYVSQWDCKRIAEELNTRPRKRHQYRTPAECFYGL